MHSPHWQQVQLFVWQVLEQPDDVGALPNVHVGVPLHSQPLVLQTPSQLL